MNQDVTTVDEKNRWRLETPGHQGWERTARPDDPHKYLMVSADCHCNEPSNLWWTRIDKKFQPRLPHIEVDEKGEKWMVVEGYQKSRLRARNVADAPKGGEDRLRGEAGRTVQDRIADHLRDGIDAEILFPNKGLAIWATQDAEFGAAQCRAWNDWAWETFSPYNDHVAHGGNHDLRCRHCDRGDQARRQARLSRRQPAMQANLGRARRPPSQLQSAAV